MGRIKIVTVLALMAISLSVAHAEKLYKWIDSQGHISYHDQPPPDGAGYSFEEKVLGNSNKKQAEDGTLDQVVAKYPVVLYSIPGCGSCDLARAYMQKRKVPFTEQNLDNNPELQQKLKKKIGSLSVPTITIGDKVMRGYVESVLEGELDDVGYPKAAASPKSAIQDQGNAGENQDQGNAGENQDQDSAPASDSGDSSN